MELSKEFKEEHKLDDAQVGAIEKHFTEGVLPDLKKEWDGKANENAEAILSGAVKHAVERSGVSLEREKGEKYGDFLNRYSDVVFDAQKKALSDKQAEIDEKLKNFKGGDEYKSQLEKSKSEIDNLLKQVADLEPLKGIDEKYKTSQQELSGLKLNVAFNNVKPAFSKDVNSFEAKARWDEFQKKVLDKYTIEIVDNEGIAVDKENHHKTIKLSELVSEDAEITKLLEGRQQKGPGADPKDMIEVKDLPFNIPKDATSEELSKTVREHLLKKLGDTLDPSYPEEFAKLFAKAKEALA